MRQTYAGAGPSQGKATLRGRLLSPPAAHPVPFGSAALFFGRGYPNANAILLRGAAPILVDPGFGSGAAALDAALAAQGWRASDLALLANTHFDCDHAGGNHHFQRRHGLPVAASQLDAALVNARHPDACRVRYLRQHVDPYRIDRPLRTGDVLDTGDGGTAWHVVAAPGHTRGQVALWSPEERILITGDALHDADLGWIDLYQEGPDTLDLAADTVERLAALCPALLLPGHGPASTDPDRAFDRARSRLRAWRERPERLAWHGCKRVFAYALMLEDGMTDAQADAYLRDAPWLEQHARHAFGRTVDQFIPMLVEEMLRGGSLVRQGDRLLAATPYDKLPPGWPKPWTRPELWPPA